LQKTALITRKVRNACFGMATSISSLLIECLGLFNALVARSDLNAHDAEVPRSLWDDELGRLRVWAANIGAHQMGQSSLDYRLRDASHIKDQIIRLLERLQRLLVDLNEVLDNPPEDGEDQFSDEEDTTELEQIYEGLIEAIGSLFQMSMLIRRPARHDRLLGTKKEDAFTFEPYDRQHVLEKYPGADSVIVNRLGSAISRRRADLKYRERHHAKLSKGIDHIYVAGNHDSQSLHDRESTVLSETIATEYKEPNIQFDETGSHSGASQTSYAPTLLEGGRAITVPPPPKESANERPFECPYCFFITTIKNKRSWARHVFRDIMPYICIFLDCSVPNRLYDSRRDWYQHLTSAHISPANTDEPHQCPLCREAGFSKLSLERHLGRHLEELALFAIPRSAGDDDIDSDRSRRSFGHDAPSEKESDNSSIDEAAERIQLSGEISSPPLDAFSNEARELLPQKLASQIEEEGNPIKCICTYTDDDGKTILCDKCKTRQHIECYYPNKDVPETHLCGECKPRPFDGKGAKERQKRLREQPDHGTYQSTSPIASQAPTERQISDIDRQKEEEELQMALKLSIQDKHTAASSAPKSRAAELSGTPTAAQSQPPEIGLAPGGDNGDTTREQDSVPLSGETDVMGKRRRSPPTLSAEDEMVEVIEEFDPIRRPSRRERQKRGQSQLISLAKGEAVEDDLVEVIEEFDPIWRPSRREREKRGQSQPTPPAKGEAAEDDLVEVIEEFDPIRRPSRTERIVEEERKRSQPTPSEEDDMVQVIEEFDPIRRRSRRERIVEEEWKRSRPTPSPDDDVVEIIEEDSLEDDSFEEDRPVRRPVRRKRGSTRPRKVDPAEYEGQKGGGGEKTKGAMSSLKRFFGFSSN
jgi:hypothetical protein